MYLSTDLANYDEFNQIIDEIKFIFSIKPESIPFNNSIGLRILGNDDEIKYNIESECRKLINSLEINNLTIESIDIFGRKVDITLRYKDSISKITI